MYCTAVVRSTLNAGGKEGDTFQQRLVVAPVVVGTSDGDVSKIKTWCYFGPGFEF